MREEKTLYYQQLQGGTIILVTREQVIRNPKPKGKDVFVKKAVQNIGKVNGDIGITSIEGFAHKTII